MCHPAAMAAMQVAQGYSNYKIQEAQVDREEELYRINARMADETAHANATAIRNRQRQEREAAGQEIDRIMEESLLVKGAAQVASAESGAGGDFDAVMRDIKRQELDKLFAVDKNLDYLDEQAEEQLIAIDYQRQNQIYSATPTTPMPSWLTPLIQAGASYGSARIAQNG